MLKPSFFLPVSRGLVVLGLYMLVFFKSSVELSGIVLLLFGITSKITNPNTYVVFERKLDVIFNGIRGTAPEQVKTQYDRVQLYNGNELKQELSEEDVNVGRASTGGSLVIEVLSWLLWYVLAGCYVYRLLLATHSA